MLLLHLAWAALARRPAKRPARICGGHQILEQRLRFQLRRVAQHLQRQVHPDVIDIEVSPVMVWLSKRRNFKNGRESVANYGSTIFSTASNRRGSAGSKG